MITVTPKNLLEFVSAFFISIGCDVKEVKDFFTARRFEEGIVLNLPAVCLLDSNKPSTSKSKQSHIHVTSKNCAFFYPASVLAGVTVSTDWEKQYVIISRENIDYLLKEPLSGHLHTDNSHMMKKIECRKTQEKQVQLSKIRDDDKFFIMLRQGLYENDVLVFLRYRDSDVLFAAGIPRSFYEGKYEFETHKSGSRAFKGKVFPSLESEDAIPVNAALESLISDDKTDEVIEGEDTIEDAIYQDLVDAAEASSTAYTPEEYDESRDSRKTKSGNRPITNPALGKEAIRDNHYHCAVDPSHETFIKPDGTRYMEAHHLIPMKWQSHFKNKLDTKGNISPVCPVCHRKLHHGRLSDIEPMLETLYKKQKSNLSLCGIDVPDLDTLKDYYK
ncbi:MAG: HNH endonuclease [Oribacterium sp.]|nr:HNH endonuclease [Oribacterium sp.]